MNHPVNHLPRRHTESEYSELRAFMLEQVQGMSGHLWTDYNLHDPGVTILEQLCYALTDINYRSEYTVEDILVDGDGKIDLHQHGMFTPVEALPCRPLTIIDYQKYFMDRMDELEYVFFTSAKLSDNKEEAGGESEAELSACLYDVCVRQKTEHLHCSEVKKTDSEVNKQEAIRKKIIQIYSEIRNLGEDINQIFFIEGESVELIASIEIDNSRSAVDVLCDIYFDINKILSGALERKSESEVNKDGKLLADVLTGPLMTSGFIDDVAKMTEEIPLSNIVNQVKNIDGITKIKSIFMAEVNGNKFNDFLPALKEKHHYLSAPEKGDEIKVQLLNKGKQIDINISEFIDAYEMHQHSEYHRQKSLAINHEKSVRSYDRNSLTDYTSVQAQFPNVYGINQHGVPARFSQERKAQALQLKGYMMLFDQLMSDHLLMLDNIKDFFSMNLNAISSYKTQALKHDSIPDIEKLYVKVPDKEFLSGDKQYEDFTERKGRVFDYLLAMNGRDKEQYGFEYKNTYFTSQELTELMLYSKSMNLKYVHEISANRAGAYNYTRKKWGRRNISAFEKYISNVIGVDARCRSFVYPLMKHKLKFLYDVDEKQDDISELDTARNNDIDDYIQGQKHNFTRVPFLKEAYHQKQTDIEVIKSSLVDENAGLSQSFLKHGVDLDMYRVGHINSKTSYDVLYNDAKKTDKIKNWKCISSFSSLKDAFFAANQYRHSLVELNLAMEGLHLIEHALLLPVESSAYRKIEDINDCSFYSHQISVLLPDWTARFSDVNFQQYAENIIRVECPAHIYVNVHWLNYSNMEKFEILFKNWLSCKHKQTDIDKLNNLSNRISGFLKSLDFSER